MTRSVLAVALIIYNLLALSTGVGATCEACPNCVYQEISPTQGNACLNYWTCSGDTISCYYPSVTDPGTYTGCSYSASAGVSELSHSDTCPLLTFLEIPGLGTYSWPQRYLSGICGR
jgi:hypothetical protein